MIYLRPLQPYQVGQDDEKKYRVTVYDPLNFYSSRVAFVLSPQIPTQPSALLAL